MTGARDLASFARAVDALRPYLADLVFVGGWAHFLHTLLPEAMAVPFTPLMTHDADIAAPLRLGVREETMARLGPGRRVERRLWKNACELKHFTHLMTQR